MIGTRLSLTAIMEGTGALAVEAKQEAAGNDSITARMPTAAASKVPLQESNFLVHDPTTEVRIRQMSCTPS